jgi:hypothetical protein
MPRKSSAVANPTTRWPLSIVDYVCTYCTPETKIDIIILYLPVITTYVIFLGHRSLATKPFDFEASENPGATKNATELIAVNAFVGLRGLAPRT